MRVRHRFSKGLAASLAAIGLAAAPASMATAAPAIPTTDVSTSTASTAAKPNIWVDIRTDGSAEFEPHGEHLYACDTWEDGLGVQAQIRWRGQFRKVNDSDGHAGQCGHRNLSIKEGTVVQIRVCVQRYGCTPWKNGTGRA